MVLRSKAAARLAVAAVLVLLSVVAAVLIAEGVIRLTMPQPVGRALPMYEPDSVLIHRLKPGFSDELRSGEFRVNIAINSFGFRGAEWKRDGGCRILVLGDSFTFGYGVDEGCVFTSLLQDSLRKRDPDATVYNAGVPGYGTTQEEHLLTELRDVVEPHVVVLAFTVGSDLRNVIEQNLRKELGYEVRQGYLVPRGMPMGRQLPVKAFLQERSHLYVLLQKTRVQMSLRRSAVRATTETCDHFLAESPCGSTAEAWKIVRKALFAMQAQCESRGATLVLLCIPHPVQVCDALWEQELKRFPTDHGLYARFGVQARLCVIAEAMGVPFVDPVDAFQQESATKLYFSLDRHMTEAGHRIIANKLLEVMKGIVKGRSEEVVDRL